MPLRFDLQGHRGARGLKPENTLPAFETALDLGVSTIETDLHLTRDGEVVLFHDEHLSDRLCRPTPDLSTRPRVSTRTLAQVRGYIVDQVADPRRFPDVDVCVTPLAQWYAEQHAIPAYAPPALTDLFALAAAYAGAPGAAAGKTDGQRQRAAQIQFALELKRVPFRPEAIGDDFDGEQPGRLERRVVEIVRAAGMIARTRVIGFDHRSLQAVRQLEPRLITAALVANTAPVDPVELVRRAGAAAYGPDYPFLDERQLRQLQAAGIRVVPWTVNEPRDWERLLDWGVDGIATDYPDRLAALLRRRGIEF